MNYSFCLEVIQIHFVLTSKVENLKPSWPGHPGLFTILASFHCINPPPPPPPILLSHYQLVCKIEYNLVTGIYYILTSAGSCYGNNSVQVVRSTDGAKSNQQWPHAGHQGNSHHGLGCFEPVCKRPTLSVVIWNTCAWRWLDEIALKHR